MKKLTTLGLLFFLTFSTFAQHHERDEKIKALKIAFITERLQLSEIEAQKFWPIYNAFDDENNKLRHQAFDKRRVDNIDSLTETEAKDLVSDMISIENQRGKLRAQFLKDLLTVIPISLDTRSVRLYLSGIHARVCHESIVIVTKVSSDSIESNRTLSFRRVQLEIPCTSQVREKFSVPHSTVFCEGNDTITGILGGIILTKVVDTEI